MNKIRIPRGARSIVMSLRYANHDAYVVGGCVRDSLLGREPKDWDICTSATPSQILYSFRDKRVIETGLKHGTVTVVMDDGQYEVTTFRVDGAYSDNRHPDSVKFVDSVYEDLARRDFTINAMAYNSAGLIDPFHGREDLERGIVSCVGNPDDRFAEDALRILRALRFASTYNFRIAEETARSIHKNKDSLKNIAVERIQSELCKLLCGEGVLDILLEFSDVMAVIIPELEPCIGFEQNNRFHQYTVYDHIAHAVSNYDGTDISVKVALLLHDIGKPLCYSEDENGGHFYGHGAPSRDLAEAALNRLRFDNKTKAEVLELVLHHDAIIEPTPKTVRRWLNKVGEEQFVRLLNIRMADIRAHAKGTQASRIERCASLGVLLEEAIKNNQCFKLKDLTINGKDIMAFGVPEGKIIGEVLNHVLDMVINGEVENNRQLLLNEVGKYLEGREDVKSNLPKE